MINNILLKEELTNIAKKYDIPIEVLYKIYRSPFEFIKATLNEYPKYHNISEEEFKNLKTSFNFPLIGKLYADYYKTNLVKKKNESNESEKD